MIKNENIKIYDTTFSLSGTDDMRFELEKNVLITVLLLFYLNHH
jgi:hypothetical protein